MRPWLFGMRQLVVVVPVRAKLGVVEDASPAGVRLGRALLRDRRASCEGQHVDERRDEVGKDVPRLR